MNGDRLYAIVMRCEEEGSYIFPSLGKQDASSKPNFAGIIEDVSVLGFDSPCQWTRDEEGPVSYTHLQVVLGRLKRQGTETEEK